MVAKMELYNRKFIFNHYDAICLVSYYSERKRNLVVLLSSSHKDTALINDETMKLILLLIYYKQIDGVDMFDQNLEFLLPPKDCALATPVFL